MSTSMLSAVSVSFVAIAACFAGTACHRAPVPETPSAPTQVAAVVESTAAPAPEASSPPEVVAAPPEVGFPWAYRPYAFMPDDVAAPVLYFGGERGAQDVTAALRGADAPLVIGVNGDKLCELEAFLRTTSHGTLSLEILEDTGKADAGCLARLAPAYLSYTVGPREDHAAEQRAFFALARAVPGLLGLGYDGFGGIIHPDVTLTSDDLAHLAAMTSIRAVALDNVELSPELFATLADLPQLRSLELLDGGVTPALLYPIAAAAKLERFVCRGGCPLGDQGMSEIAWLTNLRVLSLSDAGVTDVGVAQLERLTALEELDLTHSPAITNDGVAHLQGLVRMRHLLLSGCTIDSGALPFLAGLTELRTLHLDGTGVGGGGFEVIATLTELEVLGLSGTRVTKADLAQLVGLSRLARLELAGAPIGGDALRVIGQLTSLRSLDLTATPIEGGLQALAGLTSLEQLYLGDTNIDDRDLRRLLPLPATLRILDLTCSFVSERLARSLFTETRDVRYLTLEECLD